MGVKIEAVVFFRWRDHAPCSVMGGYQHFGGCTITAFRVEVHGQGDVSIVLLLPHDSDNWCMFKW
jgi:hypothetical protein